MSLRFAKVDKNQRGIVDALVELGFDVDDVHAVRNLGFDIIVTGADRRGNVKTVLVEVKNTGGRLTGSENRRVNLCHYPDAIIVAYNLEDILRTFGRV